MTIALILSNPGRGESSRKESENSDAESVADNIIRKKRKNVNTSYNNLEGGTLIVCPMALLGQWKVSFLCIVPNGKSMIVLSYVCMTSYK